MATTTDMIPIYFMSAMAVLVLIILFILVKKKRSKQKIVAPIQQPIIQQPQPQPLSVWSTGFMQPQSQPVAPTSEPVADSGKTSIFNRMKISMDMLLFACVGVGFLSVMTYYLSKAACVAALISGMMFIPIGVIVGAMFASNFRIKIMRKLTKKNYGMVKFVHSNKLIKPVIANLDNDIIRFGEGLYILDKNTIKREGTTTPSSDIVRENIIKFEEGIPTIYYDITDIMPIDFANSVKKVEGESDRFRLPSQVSATLNKEIAVEKAKIMKAFRTRQSLFMLIIVALIVVNLYFTYSIWSGNKTMTTTLNAINAAVNTIKGAMPATAVVVPAG